MERTEKPTPRKRQRSMQKGFVPRSPELAGALAFTAGALVLRWRGSALWTLALEDFGRMLSGSGAGPPADSADLLLPLAEAAVRWAFLLAPLLLAVPAVGVAAALAAGGFRIARAPLGFSPLAGLAKLFSPRSLAEGAKSLIKLGVIAGLTALTLRSFAPALLGRVVTAGDFREGLSLFAAVCWQLLLRCSLALAAIGFIDRSYRVWEHERKLLMSKEELKEELRETEGSPMARQRVRKRHLALARTRMIAAVRTADVVVVNPVHYAVALRYRPEVDEAPRVVAKGTGELAARIKKEASISGVLQVRNPDLARALYQGVQLGQLIPRELYHAVAEVLTYVYRLKGIRIGEVTA